MKRFIITILALATSLGADAINRGLGDPKAVYIEKGAFSASVNGSYHKWKASDGISLLGILSNTDGTISRAYASADADWFIMDNLSIGVRFGYVNTAADANSLKITELVDLTNKHVRQQSYEASLCVRRYMPLCNSKIFAVFIEGLLTGTRGYNKSYEDTARGKEGEYTDIYSADLGLIIGASAFVTDRLAITISLPKISAGIEWQEQIEKQEDKSSFRSFGFSTRPNLLGISIGTVYCF